MAAPLCTWCVRSGAPCTRPGKFRHDSDHLVCGVHLRAAQTAAALGECSVCLGPIRMKATCKVLAKCGHTFHRRCVGAWLRRGVHTCPMCRAPCLEEIGARAGTSVSAKLRALAQTLPPSGDEERLFFPTYLLRLLESPGVADALRLTSDDTTRIRGAAYQAFTEANFYTHLALLGM